MKTNVLIAVITLLSFTQLIYAGDVSGKVTDAGSGDFLPGANVTLDGTNLGTSSDRSGNFSINNAVSYTHLTLPTKA